MKASELREEKVIQTTCRLMCGACGLLAHVVDGVLVKVEPADFPEPQYRHICGKALCWPKVVNHPDRLKYPMKRVGNRGEGKWERISWDEALDTIATRLKDVGERYGSPSVAWICMAEMSWVVDTLVKRLASVTGGTYIFHLGPGDGAGPCANMANFGAAAGRGSAGWISLLHYVHGFDNPDLCVMWGANDADTMFARGRKMRDARERGAKIVVIDPRFTVTASKADQFIPIRPGTDVALALGMMNVIIAEGLYDESFVTTYTVGPFLVRSDNGLYLGQNDNPGQASQKYVVWDTETNSAQDHDAPGVVPALRGSYVIDGIECKPAFELLAEVAAQYPLETASEITEIPSEVIRGFASDYVNRKPVNTYYGMGIQRQFHGDLIWKAINTLVAISGNMVTENITEFEYDPEPIEALYQTLQILPVLRMYDAVTTEEPYPIKAMMVLGPNVVNQWPNARKVVEEMLPRMEFIAVAEMFMTATAEYADIVLPACSQFECNNLEHAMVQTEPRPYFQMQQKAIEPMYECKSDFQILAELAPRMGTTEYFDRSEEEFIEFLLSTTHDTKDRMTLEQMKQGPVKLTPAPPPTGGFRFGTPSGRMEFYTEILKKFGEELPVHKEPSEGCRTPLAEKYPLGFFQTHTKYFHHSQFANIEWMRELAREPVVEMNPLDAHKRNIRDGDMVVVFNDRGHVKIKAIVHEGIRPGLVNINQGWWPKHHVEGSHQDLTHSKINLAQEAVLAGNASYYDVMVEVRKAEEESK